ncbi:MAG TPA: hypothetical protein PLU63_00665 [Candidatus Woesebacteria bacterium]|nr:hypothetical protein [Candidatus Woesebacteria bacterium]
MEWKDIKPLTEKEARMTVKSYFINHGFEVREVDPNKLSVGDKSPDFIVTKDGNDIFYCEIKTPENKINSKTNSYQWDTTFYKLRKFLHKARKQFASFDSKHDLPWVVAFTSNHPQLNWTSFVHNIQGAVAYNGNVIKDFRSKKFIIESDKDVVSLDMIIWFQVNYLDRKTAFEVKFFVNTDLPLFTKTNEISGLLKPIKTI